MKIFNILGKMLVIGFVLSLSACGGGGEDSGGGSLSTNACSTLGLSTQKSADLAPGVEKIVEGAICGNLEKSPVVRVIAINAFGIPVGLCTGSVVGSRYVVTAAHCVVGVSNTLAIWYGDAEEANIVGVSRVRVHPNYVPLEENDLGAAFNDAAVLTAESDLPLPSVAVLTSAAPQAGDKISIFGYGADENGEFDSLVLRSGEMRLNGVSVNHLSAMYDGKGSNTCVGDSGGPAFYSLNGRIAIAGLTSTGTVSDCSEGDVSLFTNVISVIGFLRSTVPGLGEI